MLQQYMTRPTVINLDPNEYSEGLRSVCGYFRCVLNETEDLNIHF